MRNAYLCLLEVLERQGCDDLKVRQRRGFLLSALQQGLALLAD